MGLLTLTPTDKKGLNKAKKLGMVGADGVKDTELVQVNRQELSLLPQVFGTPAKVNPHTGLLSFAEGGGPGSGSSGRSGGGQGAGGGAGGGGGGGGGMGHDPGHGGANPGAQGGGTSTGPSGGLGGGGLGGGLGKGLGAALAGALSRGITGGQLSGLAGKNGLTDVAAGSLLDGSGWGLGPSKATVSKTNVGKAFDNSNETPGYYGAKPKPGLLGGLLDNALSGYGVTVNRNAALMNGVPTNTTTVDPLGAALGIAGMFNPAVNLASLGYNHIGKPLGIQGPTVTVGPSLSGESTGQAPGTNGNNGGGNNTGGATDPYRVYNVATQQPNPQQYAANNGLLQLTQPGQMIGGVWQPPYSYYAWG